MAGINKSAGVYTLGCKVNQYESEAIAEALERGGVRIDSPTRVCDAYIINTCTVTAESDRKARRFIRRAISRNPRAVIVVTGCLAQTNPQSLLAIDGVDAVVGNTEKLEAARAALRLLEQGKRGGEPILCVNDINACGFESMAIRHFDRTRAYVKIEDGCESRCTYCIIPEARGRIRSKRPEDVLEEVTALTEGGCREVVLTGIETASYGRDLENCDLAELLARIDRIPGIGRVRLGSLDPSLIRPAFVERIAGLSSLCPQFHLSLQSGSSRILALMKRKYNAVQAMEAIRLLRARLPGVQLTTDIIVGFPGETEEDFEATVDFVKQVEFLTVHIFPYSKRAGTPAAVMDGQVPEEIKHCRLHRLEAVTRDVKRTLLERAIREMPQRAVLFESYENGYAYGHTPEFLEVAVRADEPLHAQVRAVYLRETDGAVCFGELLGEEGGANAERTQ